MCVCMLVYVCVCVHICVCVHVFILTYVCDCVDQGLSVRPEEGGL